MDINFCDVTFTNPLMNASGCWCMKYNELSELNNSDSAAFISKTATLEKRLGNPEPRFKFIPNTTSSINSMGLPNEGYEYYTQYTNIFIKKPYFLSLNSFPINDLHKMLKYGVDYSVFNTNISKQFIEINVSCPNVVGKPQLAYDFETFEKVLDSVYQERHIIEDSHMKIGCKMPPYFDPPYFETVSNLFQKYPIFNFITCINSLGNGLAIHSPFENINNNKLKTLIKPKEGLGGIGGGPETKSIGLSNVYQFRKQFDKKNIDMEIIGCGGVQTGQDVIEYICSGAKLVQVGTSLMKNGPSIFKTLNSEIEEILIKNKKYKLSDLYCYSLN